MLINCKNKVKRKEKEIDSLLEHANKLGQGLIPVTETIEEYKKKTGSGEDFFNQESMNASSGTSALLSNVITRRHIRYFLKHQMSFTR